MAAVTSRENTITSLYFEFLVVEEVGEVAYTLQ